MNTSEEAWDPSQYVSYSSLVKHRQCPQAWSYRYLRGLEPLDRASYFADFGSWFHLAKAAESIQRGTELGTLLAYPPVLEVPNSKMVWTHNRADEYVSGSNRLPMSPTLVVTLARKVWDKLLTEEYREGFTEALGQPLPERLTYAFNSWMDQWEEDRAHEEPLLVEEKIRREVPGTSGAVLPGYVDEVYRDTRRGLVVVRDTKTSKKLEASDSEGDLSDSQTHLYAWGVEEKLAEHGLRVDAVAYDRIRSVAPKTPKVTASGTLSASVKDYDLGTYLEWAAGPVGEGVLWGEEGEYFATGKRKGEPKWGRYVADPKEVDRLSSIVAVGAWFQRTLTPVNRHVIRTHLQAAIDTQKAAVRTVKRFRESGEAARNFTRLGCGWCDFRKLCRAEMLGGAGGDYPLAELGLKERDR